MTAGHVRVEEAIPKGGVGDIRASRGNKGQRIPLRQRRRGRKGDSDRRRNRLARRDSIQERGAGEVRRRSVLRNLCTVRVQSKALPMDPTDSIDKTWLQKGPLNSGGGEATKMREEGEPANKGHPP